MDELHWLGEKMMKSFQPLVLVAVAVHCLNDDILRNTLVEVEEEEVHCWMTIFFCILHSDDYCC